MPRSRPWRPSLALASALAVAAMIAVGCRDARPAADERAEPSGPVPAAEEFYGRVDPAPPGPTGEVLASEPLDVRAALRGGGGGEGARAWRVLYRSERLDGEPVAVSGLVVRPAGDPPPGGWPVLSWAHGTTGSADGCAPSRAGLVSIPQLERILSAGYVVAATDYEGLGTPGPHPYLVGESEGRSVLDAARAARSLVPEATGPVLAWGHSQGGQAALWAGELASSYAPDLGLVGVAAFAPAVRQETFLEVAGSRQPSPLVAGFTVAAAAGLAAARPELQLSDLLSDGALARLDVLESGCIAQVAAAFAMVPGGVLREEPDQLDDWQQAVEDNQAGNQRSDVPVLVLQGEGDVLVPPAAAERFRRAACGVGSDVELRRYADADHGSIVGRAWDDAERWSSDRLADLAVEGC